MKITLFALLFVLGAFAYAGTEGTPMKFKDVSSAEPITSVQRKSSNRKTSVAPTDSNHAKLKKDINTHSTTVKPANKNHKNGGTPKPGRKAAKKAAKKDHHHHDGQQAAHKKPNHDKKHSKHRSHTRKEKQQKKQE